MTFPFDIKLDLEKLEEGIYKQAEAAALKTANYTLGRAQKHAPVRKIFQGTTHRHTELFDRYASPAGVAREPVLKRVRTPDEGRADRLGHANSQTPVFKSGVNHRETGDFRRTQLGGMGFELQSVSVQRSRVQRGGKVTSETDLRGTISGESKLTTRGRFEVQSGRANFKSPADGHIRVGGRLRGELYVSGPTREAGYVWAYVVSPTKDPDTGYPYNRAMEFGTVHNRPHPFLRPALAESRSVLSREARSHLRSVRR